MIWVARLFLEVNVLQIFVHFHPCFKSGSKLTGLQMSGCIFDGDGECVLFFIQKYGENMSKTWSFVGLGIPI